MTMDPGEAKALADIDRYGCHVLHVAAEGDLPPFSYSVGIWRSSRQPEIVVIGLKQELAHSVVNEYNRRVRAGETFAPGALYAEFIEGFDVTFEKVEPQFYGEYFGWNLWLYGGPEFEVLQLVYPTTTGIWPWQAPASDWFRSWQPILCSDPDPLDQLFDVVDGEPESSPAFAAALKQLEMIASAGSRDAAEEIAAIFAFSDVHRDSAKAYLWYHIALARHGFSTEYANRDETAGQYRGPDGDFRNEPQVNGLVGELGEKRVRELDALAAAWLAEHPDGQAPP